MSALSYLCAVIGEPAERIPRLHASTIARITAYGIAIHIPVAIWAATGYLTARQFFNHEVGVAAAISLGCAGMIYLVERLVITTPKTWSMNVLRILIGLIVAVLGASTVDLVVFEREVNEQLLATHRNEINAKYAFTVDQQTKTVQSMKADWDAAVVASTCEANGTCGSRHVSVGPIYRELARQAETRRHDYLKSLAKLDNLKAEWSARLTTLDTTPETLNRAGLLSRIEALHTYVTQNRAAFVAWAMFFLLISLFESMVIVVKLVFGETVDDRIEKAREAMHDHLAAAYLAAQTSPLLEARTEIEKAFGRQ